MTNPIAIPEHSGPFLLSIGLDWFFDKFTRGVHGFATTSREFGLYLQSLDATEIHIHVDFPEEIPHLCYIYPKPLWVESVRRMGEIKQRSEADRQARFAKEIAAKELQSRFARREEEIQRILRIIQGRFPSFWNKNSAKMLRIIVIKALRGDIDEGFRKKLGICAETIAEFLALPQPVVSEEESLMGLVEDTAPPVKV